MRSTSFRLRAAAIAAALALPFAAVIAAAPAQAADAPIPAPKPVVELDTTTFPAGSWGAGFTIDGTGFAPDLPVNVGIGADGPDGSGSVFNTTILAAADGTIHGTIVPDAVTRAPDADGFPKYSIYTSQQQGDDLWVYGNRVDLTITEGTSIEFPAEVTPEQLAAGVGGSFAGFAAGEPIYYEVVLSRYIGDAVEDIDGYGVETDADAAGGGTFSDILEGAEAGDFVRIYVLGDETGREAEGWAQVVAELTPAPAPAPAPAAPAATGPKLAETGVDLTVGLVAAGLLVLGAAGVVVRRRFATR